MMCQSPSTLDDGTTFACRKCPQCRDLYIDDWEGRNLAESKSASASMYVTLTYGRVDNEVHHAHSVALFYSDVQKYLKLLRYHGYVVRYFNAGEFGGLKGRTHWHLILHFYGAVPPHVHDEDFMHEAIKADGTVVTDKSGKPRYFWPHGWSHWKRAHKGSVRYCCKYSLKDMDDLENQSILQMTKNPPLGAIYFREMARSAARQGVGLHDASYSFGDVVYTKGDKAGQRRIYMLRGKSEEIYVQAYLDEYRKVWGKEPPQTQYIQEWDKGWKRELRRIAERRKERVGKWSGKDHLKHRADTERRREIEQKIREAENKAYFQVPAPGPKRGPRDLDEWKNTFEKEWVRYGEAKRVEQWRPEPERHLLGEFERVWQDYITERRQFGHELWARVKPDHAEFWRGIRAWERERNAPTREPTEFERWIAQRRKRKPPAKPKFKGL